MWMQMIEFGAVCGMAGAMILGAIAHIFSVYAEYSERRDGAIVREIRANAVKDLGTSMAQQAHWFSESEDAMSLVQALAEHLRQGASYCTFDADKARAIWREKRKVLTAELAGARTRAKESSRAE